MRSRGSVTSASVLAHPTIDTNDIRYRSAKEILELLSSVHDGCSFLKVQTLNPENEAKRASDVTYSNRARTATALNVIIGLIVEVMILIKTVPSLRCILWRNVSNA